MSAIGEANRWAAEVWKVAVNSWETREQDYNYRRFVASPAMRAALKLVDPLNHGIFLDLGCGDGSELGHIRGTLLRRGNSGIFFGFDFQESLIEAARNRKWIGGPIQTSFDHGNLANLVRKHNLVSKVDRTFSTFLLQELADADACFKLSAECLKKGGLGIFLFLHPAFGTAMRAKGAVRINEKLVSKSWRWAAEYPIVEEGGRTFYVPYFHRELADYIELAGRHFSEIKVLGRQPTANAVRKCEREHRSPFYDHPGNVYFPEIVTIPSSLIFLVRK